MGKNLAGEVLAYVGLGQMNLDREAVENYAEPLQSRLELTAPIAEAIEPDRLTQKREEKLKRRF